MPIQIYKIEKVAITVFIQGLFVVNLILTILNAALILKLSWNPPPGYFSNLLLLCHMLATGLKLPGGVTDFNEQIVKAVTLNFGTLFQKTDHVKYSELDS
jgi:hypothetical protein